MSAPRVTDVAIDRALGGVVPFARAARRCTAIASDMPARSTNVGAQRWVIQRVRNCAAGSGEPGFQKRTESVNTRPRFIVSEA